MSRSIKSPAKRAPRIMLYSHDTLGYGHLRRNLLIAKALSEIDQKPEILLIGGMREAGAFVLPPRTDCVTLPAYAKQGDGSYRPRELGDDIARLARMRSRIIKSVAAGFDPNLLIVDNVPRGAQFELDNTLAALSRRGHCRIVLGLRDVIDDSQVVRRQWLRQRNFETVRRYYDQVWIYGDPNLYDILSDCGMDERFGSRAHYLGLLDPTGRGETKQAAIDLEAIIGNDRRPYVFCAVGGGRDGADLCEAFARAPMPAGHRGVLVTGTQMPETLRDGVLKHAEAREDMVVLPFVHEPFGVMAGAARLVGMGGYNTTMEFLAIDAPALIVPRYEPRREQVMRTTSLAARGLVSMLLPEDLSPASIGDWLADPVSQSGTVPDMNGLPRVRDMARAALADAPTAAAIQRNHMPKSERFISAA